MQGNSNLSSSRHCNVPSCVAVPGLAAALLAAISIGAGGCGCGHDIEGDAGDDLTEDVALDTATEPDPLDDVIDVPEDSLPDTAADPDVPSDTAADDDGSDVAEADPDAGDVAEEDAPPPVPAGCIEAAGLEPYFGNLHAHTTNSDGEGTPADAFAYARDVAGLDIMVVTDHLEQLYIPFGRWDTCREDADAANAPGSYVAACGYEYGSGFILPWFQSTGHNNVFFEDSLFPEIQVDFHDFYDSVVACADCVTQFNHPGDDPTMTWNDFEYFPAVDMKMNLFEFNTPASAWDLYFQALDMGWHISPMINQDNHSANWGTANETRSGFWMGELTREELHLAMQKRRSFMTMDSNAHVKAMGWDTCWMGTIAAGRPDLPLDVEAVDADAGDGFDTIEIFGPGKALLGSYDCLGAETCAASFDLTATGPIYVVTRAVELDGDYLVAAPIWLYP